LNFTVKYKQRVAVLGKNGCGKSTFFRILMGEYTSDKGEAVFGANVMPAYLEQNIQFKNEELTVIDTFRENLNILEGPARGILAKFLFYGEDVFKKVKSLSGGEKSRLKLCMLIQEDINTLILDEPTNHLDIDSREMLEEAMENFKGTILFVSHDRYFINKIATRILEFNDGNISDFSGSYEEYKERKLQRSLLEGQNREDNIIEIKEVRNDIEKITPNKKNEFKIKRMEERISVLEERVSINTSDIEKYSSDFSKLTDLLKEKDKLQSELDSAMEEWLNYIQE
jgi:ABC-type multidrug transport system ATPase subunit